MSVAYHHADQFVTIITSIMARVGCGSFISFGNVSVSLLEQWNNGARSDTNNVAMIPPVSGGLRLQALSREVTLLSCLLLPLRNLFFKKDSEMFLSGIICHV
jgi:hypothetical protein